MIWPPTCILRCEFVERVRRMSVSQLINEMVQARPARVPAKRPSDKPAEAFERRLSEVRDRSIGREDARPEPRVGRAEDAPPSARPDPRPERPDRPAHPHRAERAEPRERPDHPSRDAAPDEVAQTRPPGRSAEAPPRRDAVDAPATGPEVPAADQPVVAEPAPGSEAAAVPVDPAAAAHGELAAALAGGGQTPASPGTIAMADGTSGSIIATSETPNAGETAATATSGIAATGTASGAAPAVPGQAGALQSEADGGVAAAPSALATVPVTAPQTRPTTTTAHAEAATTPPQQSEAPAQNAAATAKADPAQFPQAQQGGQPAAQAQPQAGFAIQMPQTQASAAPPSPTATPQHAQAQAENPVPMQAVAVEIGMRAMRGAKEFQIRLDPEDLGRIDVRLEIGEKGDVQAKLVVERVETLHLLQRDARTLERAFDQAGLKTSPDALQFSLRDPGQQAGGEGRSNRDGEPGQRAARGIEPASDEQTKISAIYRAPATGGLDIRI